MEIEFIGLGNMGFPMARRLIQAGHRIIAFDTSPAALDRIVGFGAKSASSPKEVANDAETVMASLPSPQVALAVATGVAGVVEGSRVERYIDLSTVGSQTAVQIHDALADRTIATLDAPVSGGVRGAEDGSLAMTVSGPRNEFDILEPVLETIGTPFYMARRPARRRR